MSDDADRLRAEAASSRRAGDLAGAARAYEAAATLLRDEPLRYAHALRHLGDVAFERGDRDRAARAYAEALAVYRVRSDAPPLDLANAIRSCAILKQSLGHNGEAIALWTEARTLYEKTGIAAGVAEAARRLAALGDLSFLDFAVDFNAPNTINAYDELPLWSAMFGLLMLAEVPLRGVTRALDAGCGTGFPLIELAERLGPAAVVDGIDPWSGALDRAKEKIAARGTLNVRLHEGSASAMPFDDEKFDLIVSNLGLNNFGDRAAAARECRRVIRDGGVLALTTNVQGHMRELYEAMEPLLDAEERQRLAAHVGHRATVEGVRTLLQDAGFLVTRVVEQEQVMRFAGGTALFNHYFIRLGFLDGWKSIVESARQRDVFSALMNELDDGELRLTIPMVYIEARA
jgi:arsenite methyltransferase